MDAFIAHQEKERSLIPRLDTETKQRILDAGDGSAECSVTSEEAQWLNMDARDMDAAVLGRYVARASHASLQRICLIREMKKL